MANGCLFDCLAGVPWRRVCLGGGCALEAGVPWRRVCLGGGGGGTGGVHEGVFPGYSWGLGRLLSVTWSPSHRPPAETNNAFFKRH